MRISSGPVPPLHRKLRFQFFGGLVPAPSAEVGPCLLAVLFQDLPVGQLYALYVLEGGSEVVVCYRGVQQKLVRNPVLVVSRG